MALHNFSFAKVDDNGNYFSDVYFSSATDSWITVLNFVSTILVLGAPLACEYVIRSNEKNLESRHFTDKFEVLLEGNVSNLDSALYTVYFLYRRFFTVLVLVFMTEWPFF